MDMCSEKLKSLYPNTYFGILKVKNFNPTNFEGFNIVKQNEIEKISPSFENYLRADFVKTEPINYYVNFFKKFKKTYVVLLQMESIFVKKYVFPKTNPAIQALFLTELKHGVLAAACDMDKMNEPFSLEVADGEETYIGMEGKLTTLKRGDIYLRDADGIVVSIIYGQDLRTRVADDTKNIMFIVKGVEGVSSDIINSALTDLSYYINEFDKSAEIFELQTIR